MVLVIFFGVVEIHEVVPFLHEEAPAGDMAFPEDYCPFCLIKYALSLALVIAPILFHALSSASLPFSPYAPDVMALLPGLSSSRAPPSLRMDCLLTH